MERESHIVLHDLLKTDTIAVGSLSGLLTTLSTPAPLDVSLSTFWWLMFAVGKFIFFVTTGTVLTAILKAHVEPLVERLPWLRRFNKQNK